MSIPQIWRKRRTRFFVGLVVGLSLTAGVVLSGIRLLTARPSETAPAEGMPEATPSPSARGTGFLGCWDTIIELPWPVGDTEGQLCVQEGEGQLGGRFLLNDAWRPLQSPRLDGSSLTFSIEAPVGTARFELELSGDHIAGTADGKFGKRPLRATRR